MGLDMGPVITIDKFAAEEKDYGDGDGTLEVGERLW